MSEWIPDVLGEEFEQLTLPLGEDEQGEVVATLVRALPRERTWWERVRGWHPELHDVDVLYVHGWSDYFFNKRFARTWTELGARFFALDLRKYGRSLREGQTAGYVHDLAAYDEDIAAALTEMGRTPELSPRRLVLVGHSTGGLTLSLWAHRNPGVASALILNSPWLELQLAGLVREAIMPLLSIQAKLQPLAAAPQIDAGFYSRAQAEVADPQDPMDINLDWRPLQSLPVTPGWLKAIVDGHHTVDEGLTIDVPVCVMLSARSVPPRRWSEEMTAADTVLTVERIAEAAVKLGSSVTIERIEGALHDIFLSRREVRDEAYDRMRRWVLGWNLSSSR